MRQCLIEEWSAGNNVHSVLYTHRLTFFSRQNEIIFMLYQHKIRAIFLNFHIHECLNKESNWIFLKHYVQSIIQQFSSTAFRLYV